MPQVINAVSKNANFIILYNYDVDTTALSAPIESIPLSILDLKVFKNADGVSSTLFVKKGASPVLNIQVNDADSNTILYVIENGVENGSLITLGEVSNFFLNP